MSSNHNKPLRIGTRGSPLALAQARLVQVRWHDAYGDAVPSEIVTVNTTGDRVQDRPLSEIGGKGLFTRELDAALVDGRIDIAVHSMKDVPTFLPEPVVIAAMLPRDDPRDGWIAVDGCSIETLPAGSVVGTCSLRRRSQLLARRPDLSVVDLRGNIQTRLKKLQSGAFKATMLAMAGLRRMAIDPPGLVPLAVDAMVPAAGQAAIGIAVRRDHEGLAHDLQVLDHAPTTACIECERALLAKLDGSCRTPIGAYAAIVGSVVSLHALLASPDGSIVHQLRREGGLGDRKSVGSDVGYELKRRAGPDFLKHW